MRYREKKVTIRVVQEDGEYAIAYNGKWYRSFADFCLKAEIEGNKVTTVSDEFYHLEVKND